MKATSECKVVTQYHSAGEMVYELDCADVSLEVRVSSQSVGRGERSWHVSAQQRLDPDATVVTDFADTKSSALTKVGERWSEQATELGLPSLDWKLVAAALLAVRGI